MAKNCAKPWRMRGNFGNPRKAAEIIAVDGDPLADVTVLTSVRFVMKGGTVLKE